MAGLLLALFLGVPAAPPDCPPDEVWQVVTYYEYPPGWSHKPADPQTYTGGPVLRYVEMKCGQEAAWARQREIQANGFGIPLSWYCNWVSPSRVRGFAVTPEIR